MLEVDNITTYLGTTLVLQGLTLKVGEGCIVALLGRNGMGKTTTIRSIMGDSPPVKGDIRYKSQSLVGRKSYEIARMGIGLVPQGRHIFPSLSVKENLWMPARNAGADGAWNLERVYRMFPVLEQRAKISGSYLSGGEQQMLCIGRALMTNPSLVLMDEPSEGLSPRVVADVAETCRVLRDSGLSILLVEQNLKLALEVADYVYVVSKGSVVYEGTAQDLSCDPDTQERCLGVSL